MTVIRYGSDRIDELKFTSFKTVMERRDEQWVDINLTPRLATNSAELPSDLIDFSILVICNHSGVIAQMVPQDIGCDCEYQLTFSEKEQVKAWMNSGDIQRQLKEVVDTTF
jgi:hypothetical protein